jgi:hypothetical protein
MFNVICLPDEIISQRQSLDSLKEELEELEGEISGLEDELSEKENEKYELESKIINFSKIMTVVDLSNNLPSYFCGCQLIAYYHVNTIPKNQALLWLNPPPRKQSIDTILISQKHEPLATWDRIPSLIDILEVK